MITLKYNDTNTVAYQKEYTTPLESHSYEEGKVFNIVLYPTLANDTGSAGITYTTSSTEDNPRWETLKFDISSTSDYNDTQIGVNAGNTYNLEVWYGDKLQTSPKLVWGETTSSFGSTGFRWSYGGQDDDVQYADVIDGEKRYSDRVFISGSTLPTKKKYISSNENAVYQVYQG